MIVASLAEAAMYILAAILGSMAGKVFDPLFLLIAAIGIVIAWRRYWLAAIGAYLVGAAVNIAMVWSLWDQVGIEPITGAAWLLFIWLLWGAVITGIAYGIRRLIAPPVRQANG